MKNDIDCTYLSQHIRKQLINVFRSAKLPKKFPSTVQKLLENSLKPLIEFFALFENFLIYKWKLCCVRKPIKIDRVETIPLVHWHLMINWISNILIWKNTLIFGVKLSICGFFLFQNKYLILRFTDWNYLFCDIVKTTPWSVKSSQKKNKQLIITASTFNAYLVFMHTFESIMRSLTAVSNKRQARKAIMQSRAVFNLNNFKKRVVNLAQVQIILHRT